MVGCERSVEAVDVIIIFGSSYFVCYLELPVMDVLRYRGNSAGFSPWAFMFPLML